MHFISISTRFYDLEEMKLNSMFVIKDHRYRIECKESEECTRLIKLKKIMTFFFAIGLKLLKCLKKAVTILMGNYSYTNNLPELFLVFVS